MLATPYEKYPGDNAAAIKIAALDKKPVAGLVGRARVKVKPRAKNIIQIINFR